MRSFSIRSFLGFTWVLVFCLTSVVPLCALETMELSEHLLVVYNRRAIESEGLAQYYAKARSIPKERLLGINCPDQEEISRAVFEEKVLGPIEHYLEQKGWLLREKIPRERIATRENNGEAASRQTLEVPIFNQIWAIALVRGMPLKIKHDPERLDAEAVHLPALLTTNAASVDSELAALPIRGRPLWGPLIHPYAVALPHPFNALDSKEQILVTRLDAPTANDVRRMIDETLEAEQNGLKGRAYVDLRGLHDPNDPYAQGETWLRGAADLLKTRGWNVDVDDTPGLFPPDASWNNAAVYLGWYQENASGPFMHEPRVFAPGAIGYHIHSYSASTLHSTTVDWAGPLLAHGVCATMGCVYEPGLALTPHVDLFVQRLLEGWTFAEAAGASQKFISWMVTAVGDPLYRPFAALQPAEESVPPSVPEQLPFSGTPVP